MLDKEKGELLDEVRHLKLEVEEERSGRRTEQAISNGPIGDELQQTLNDLRFRVQKAEQETSTLTATVRLFSSIHGYYNCTQSLHVLIVLCLFDHLKSLILYSVRGLEPSELGGSHGCPGQFTPLQASDRV